MSGTIILLQVHLRMCCGIELASLLFPFSFTNIVFILLTVTINTRIKDASVLSLKPFLGLAQFHTVTMFA